MLPQPLAGVGASAGLVLVQELRGSPRDCDRRELVEDGEQGFLAALVRRVPTFLLAPRGTSGRTCPECGVTSWPLSPPALGAGGHGLVAVGERSCAASGYHQGPCAEEVRGGLGAPGSGDCGGSASTLAARSFCRTRPFFVIAVRLVPGPVVVAEEVGDLPRAAVLVAVHLDGRHEPARGVTRTLSGHWTESGLTEPLHDAPAGRGPPKGFNLDPPTSWVG